MTSEHRTVTVTMPGKPMAQPRARFSRRGNFVRTYEPKEATAHKETWALLMIQALGAVGGVPLQGPLELHILAVMPRPTSMPKRLGAGRRWHDKRPDSDNIAKLVMDSANGVLYGDDGQIARLVIEKYVAAIDEAPRMTLTATEIPQPQEKQ
jgi:Holliday junction resolvase RusA-like endonuclease